MTASDRSLDAAPFAQARDARIDFFRGLALIFIFIDHIPGNVFANVTLTNFGFADAAEIFVLLAGYAAFLAYRRALSQDLSVGLVKICSRIGELYVPPLIVLMVCVLGLAAPPRPFPHPPYFPHP